MALVGCDDKTFGGVMLHVKTCEEQCANFKIKVFVFKIFKHNLIK